MGETPRPMDMNESHGMSAITMRLNSPTNDNPACNLTGWQVGESRPGYALDIIWHPLDRRLLQWRRLTAFRPQA